jgi:hypothetical protein
MKFKEMFEASKQYYIVGDTTLDGKTMEKSVLDLYSGEVIMYDKFIKNPTNYSNFLLTKREANALVKEEGEDLSIEKI